MTAIPAQRTHPAMVPTPRATLTPRPPAPKAEQRGSPAVDVQNFSFAYGSRQILRNLTFTIQRKSVTAIIGPSDRKSVV